EGRPWNCPAALPLSLSYHTTRKFRPLFVGQTHGREQTVTPAQSTRRPPPYCLCERQRKPGHPTPNRYSTASASGCEPGDTASREARILPFWTRRLSKLGDYFDLQRVHWQMP